MVLNVEQPQPALLAEGERDEAAKLYQFGLGELAVQPLPEHVVVGQSPRDGLGVAERSLLPLAEPVRGLEVQQVVILSFGEALLGRLDRALVTAVLTVDRPRDVDPAQLLDAVIADTGAEDVLPGPGECPEAGGHVGTDRRALRPWRALPATPFHLGAHL